MDAMQPWIWNPYAVASLHPDSFSYQDLVWAKVGQRLGFIEKTTEAIHFSESGCSGGSANGRS